jgi:hypothetical protein
MSRPQAAHVRPPALGRADHRLTLDRRADHRLTLDHRP